MSTTYDFTIGQHKITFRKPTHAEWRRFKVQVTKSDQKGAKPIVDCVEELVRSMISSPSSTEVDVIADEYGNVFELIGEEIDLMQSGAETKRASKSGGTPRKD